MATVDTLRKALKDAFAVLIANRGGQLIIPAGEYDLGHYYLNTPGAAYDPLLSSRTLFGVSGLANTTIDATGAKFRIATHQDSSAYSIEGESNRFEVTLFEFTNPENVMFKGGKVCDSSASITTVDHSGTVAIRILKTATGKAEKFFLNGFVAENVNTLFRADPPAGVGKISELDIRATAIRSYYGVNVLNDVTNSVAFIDARNVRRAFIGYDINNWKVFANGYVDPNVKGFTSNAFIELAPLHQNIFSVDVDLRYSGTLGDHQCLVHLYHQGLSQSLVFENINSRVTNGGTTGKMPDGGGVTCFSHSPEGKPPYSSTARSWQNIRLSGVIPTNNRASVQLKVFSPELPDNGPLRSSVYLDTALQTVVKAEGGTLPANMTMASNSRPSITWPIFSSAIVTTGDTPKLCWNAADVVNTTVRCSSPYFYSYTSSATGTVCAPNSPVAASTGLSTCTITGTDELGATSVSFSSISVVPPPTIEAASFSSANVTSGNSNTLSWTLGGGAVSASVSCSGVASGSGTSSPLTVTTVGVGTGTCTVTASNAAGASVTRSASFTSVPPPSITGAFFSPAQVISGGKSQLCWNAANVVNTKVSCTPQYAYAYDGPATGTVCGPGDTVTVGTGTGTCTITGTNAAGTTSVLTRSISVVAR